MRTNGANLSSGDKGAAHPEPSFLLLSLDLHGVGDNVRYGSAPEAPMPATVVKTPVTHPATTLGKALGFAHERWLAGVRAALAPALLDESTRWDRWTAVRYLRDRFTARLEQERRFVRGIPGLDRAVLAQIEAGCEALERLRAQVDLAGRRRHTGGVVMLLLTNFLERLNDWCAAVEHAVATIPRTTLPPDALELLADLEGVPA
jgi:hypothetical protein